MTTKIKHKDLGKNRSNGNIMDAVSEKKIEKYKMEWAMSIIVSIHRL